MVLARTSVFLVGGISGNGYQNCLGLQGELQLPLASLGAHFFYEKANSFPDPPI